MAHLSFLILTLKHRNNRVDINIPNYLLAGWSAWLNADFSNHTLLNPQLRQCYIPVVSPNPCGFRNEQKAILLFQHACGAAPDHIPALRWDSTGSSQLQVWIQQSHAKPCMGHQGRKSKAGSDHPPFHMENTWPSAPSASPATATMQEMHF